MVGGGGERGRLVYLARKFVLFPQGTACVQRCARADGSKDRSTVGVRGEGGGSRLSLCYVAGLDTYDTDPAQDVITASITCRQLEHDVCPMCAHLCQAWGPDPTISACRLTKPISCYFASQGYEWYYYEQLRNSIFLPCQKNSDLFREGLNLLLCPSPTERFINTILRIPSQSTRVGGSHKCPAARVPSESHTILNCCERRGERT